MSKSSFDGKHCELVHALEKARDYLVFTADKSKYSNNEFYLVVRNYLEQTIKEIQVQHFSADD